MTKALQDHVKATIAPYKYPRAIEYVAELPKTQTGKLQRFELRRARRRRRCAQARFIRRHRCRTARTLARPAANHRNACSRTAGRAKGYANGIKARGEFVFVGGMVGWDEQEKFPEGFVAQARQALQNIVAVLAEGGARPEHVVRLTWYVLDMDEYLARPQRARRRLPRGDGRPFPGDGAGAGRPAVRAQGAARDRGHGGRAVAVTTDSGRRSQQASAVSASQIAMMTWRPAVLFGFDVAAAAVTRCSAMIAGGISRTASQMPSGTINRSSR